jgi:hypothetical protein
MVDGQRSMGNGRWATVDGQRATTCEPDESTALELFSGVVLISC